MLRAVVQAPVGVVVAEIPRLIGPDRLTATGAVHLARSIQITYDRYGHLMPGNEEEAAGLLDAYLDRSTGVARV